MKNQEKRKRKKVSSYTIMLDFQIKNKKDCDKFLELVKKYRKNILRGCYAENEK